MASNCTDICRSILLERMVFNNHSNITVPDEFLEHKNYVFNLLKSTVQNGENNSALLIGPGGSGKTLVSITFQLLDIGIIIFYIFS